MDSGLKQKGKNMEEEGIKTQDIVKATEVKATDLLLATTKLDSGSPANQNISAELLKKFILQETETKAKLENGTTGDITLKKLGNIVVASGRIAVTAIKAGTTLATIPAEYCPSRYLRFPVSRYDLKYGVLGITADGTVALVNDTQLSENNKEYYINATWALIDAKKNRSDIG